MLRFAVAVCTGELESCTCTVKDKVPEEVGVPPIAPLDLVKDKPAGSCPADTVQLYGEVPPVAERPVL